MIKELMKKQMKKTGTYREVEIKAQKLKIQLQTLQDDKQKIQNHNKKLVNQVNGLQKTVDNFNYLKTNLMAENKSLKQIYLKEDISFSPDYNQLTIIIPYRKTDDPQREENMGITLNYLSKLGIRNIIISEHSNKSTKQFLIDKYENLFESFSVIFDNSNGSSFNKSRSINQGVIKSKTPYFAAFDMDTLTKKKNIDLAIYLLDREFEVVHPFNRMVMDITDKESFIEDYDFSQVNSSVQYRDWADGGIVFWNKNSFIDIGMMNEHFQGWGGEDTEILIRANVNQIKQIRIDDILYHLYHYRPQKRPKKNADEIILISKLKSKKELQKEIRKWPWVVKAKEADIKNN